MMSVYIETYGCQMNVYDTEIVRSILRAKDFQISDDPDTASVILLNTCSVRENAHRRVMRRIDVLKAAKKKNPELILGVIGCMAQSLKSELLDDGIGVDIIAGPDTYRKLPELIDQFRSTGVKGSELLLSRTETYSDVFPTHDEGANAFVAAMRGCNNACSFCIVPYARGRERSRDPESIVEEVTTLAGRGYKQITLLGQNVNSYAFGGCTFAGLIRRVSDIDGIKRIRFMSPHPKDFPDELIETVKYNPKVCKHIHLPLQSGNDRILTMMRRTYSRQEYINLALRIRDEIQGVAVTTDVIVGFPTETEDEFHDTLEVMRRVEFDSAFMFKYSERKHTLAERSYEDDIADEDKTSRIMRLVDLQRKISFGRNSAQVGKIFEVLVEGRGKRPQQLLGRNDGNRIVVFGDNGACVGDLVSVRIDEATPNTLIGHAV